MKIALDSANLSYNEVSNIVATGYGRSLVKAKSTSSEITCISRGVYKLFPSARIIIDVGGQDSKAIKIDKEGRALNFMMNDKCAAGTGRFLEVMSNIMKLPIEKLGEMHFKSKDPTKISNTCTVFAESEVISHISKGCEIDDVIAGIHNSIAVRIYNMASRIGFEKDVTLTGGVAKNHGFVDALTRKMGLTPMIPEDPQIICALGAALKARQLGN